jgi:hypothetical protein
MSVSAVQSQLPQANTSDDFENALSKSAPGSDLQSQNVFSRPGSTHDSITPAPKGGGEADIPVYEEKGVTVPPAKQTFVSRLPSLKLPFSLPKLPKDSKILPQSVIGRLVLTGAVGTGLAMAFAQMGQQIHYEIHKDDDKASDREIELFLRKNPGAEIPEELTKTREKGDKPTKDISTWGRIFTSAV